MVGRGPVVIDLQRYNARTRFANHGTPSVSSVQASSHQAPKSLSTWDQALLNLYREPFPYRFTEEMIIPRGGSVAEDSPYGRRLKAAIDAGRDWAIGHAVYGLHLDGQILTDIERPKTMLADAWRRMPSWQRVNHKREFNTSIGETKVTQAILEKLGLHAQFTVIQSAHRDKMATAVEQGRASVIGKTVDELGLDKKLVGMLRDHNMIWGSDGDRLTEAQFMKMPLHIRYLVVRQNEVYGKPSAIARPTMTATSSKEILNVADVSRGIWRLSNRDSPYYVLFLDKEKVMALPGVVVADQVFPELLVSAQKNPNILAGRLGDFSRLERKGEDMSLIRIVPEKVRRELASAYGDRDLYFSHYVRPVSKNTYAPQYPIPSSRNGTNAVGQINIEDMSHIGNGRFLMASRENIVRSSDGRTFMLDREASEPLRSGLRNPYGTYFLLKP